MKYYPCPHFFKMLSVTKLTRITKDFILMSCPCVLLSLFSLFNDVYCLLDVALLTWSVNEGMKQNYLCQRQLTN